MLTSLRRAVEGAYQGGSIIILAARFVKAEQGIGMTNEAVTPYAGTVIDHRLHKSIIEHCPFARDVRKRFERLRRPSLLQIFFLVFFTCSLQVRLLSS